MLCTQKAAFRSKFKRQRAPKTQAQDFFATGLLICRREGRKGVLLLEGKGDQILQFTAMPTSVKLTLDQEEETSASGLEVSDEWIIKFIQAWQARTFYLPREIFVDPAWNMLLELYLAQLKNKRMSSETLYSLSGTSGSAAVRWLKVLESQRLIICMAEPENTDREFVELSSNGEFALRSYFCNIAKFANNISSPV